VSRVAAPSEKIVAVAGIYRALIDELPDDLHTGDPIVQASLLDAGVRIAMATDTRDMGILTLPLPPAVERIAAAHHLHNGQEGDHHVYPCDDCGWIEGHDPDVEH
jgi:hypothetical protein